MKYFIFILIPFLFIQSLSAQEETLLTSSEENGGFGGPVFKYSSICGKGSFLIGGRGGWILNHSLILGGGGYGLITEVDAPDGVMSSQGPIDVKFEYIGFEIEYLFKPMSLIHLSISTLIGFGDTYYVKDAGSVSESNQQITEKAYMFVAEPSVSAELNIISWFRLDAGISYRFVPEVEHIGLSASDFSAPAFTIVFKFGSF